MAVLPSSETPEKLGMFSVLALNSDESREICQDSKVCWIRIVQDGEIYRFGGSLMTSLPPPVEHL